MIGHVIILFNTTRFLAKQYELFTKHIQGQFIVVDNSTKPEVIHEVHHFCRNNNIRLIKPDFQEGDFSRSHGMACNYAYEMLNKDYEILGFYDHDLFPVFDIDIKSLMQGKVIAGVPQITSETYLWAGLTIINNETIDKAAVDFMPSPGKDTGGEISRIFKHLPETAYHLFAERPEDKVTKIYFDIESKEPCFLHLRNGSGWKQEEGREQRVNEFMNTLP